MTVLARCVLVLRGWRQWKTRSTLRRAAPRSTADHHRRNRTPPPLCHASGLCSRCWNGRAGREPCNGTGLGVCRVVQSLACLAGWHCKMDFVYPPVLEIPIYAAIYSVLCATPC